MTEFEAFKGGTTEAQVKLAHSYLFIQSTTPGLVRNGVLSGLVVAQTTTASGSVLIGSGAGVVQSSVSLGVNHLVSDAQKTLNVFGSNPMGATARNDIVVFDRVTPAISVIVGTPNASPTDPTVPNTAIPLARLRHAASATTIPDAKIDDLRVITGTANTPVYVPSIGSRNALAAYEGMVVYRADLDDFQQYTDGSWSFEYLTLPSIPAALQIYDSGAGFEYGRKNGIIYTQGAMERTDGGDLAASGVSYTLGTLPTGYRPINRLKMRPDSFGTTGGHLWISATTGDITFTPGASGVKWVSISGISFPASLL